MAYIATGKVNFDGFSNIAGHFLEEEDAEAMQQELKEAFRLYDREGNGYITTSTLKEILAALDDKLNNSDLDGIIAEIDTDGSGTVDFDGKLFCEWNFLYCFILNIILFFFLLQSSWKWWLATRETSDSRKSVIMFTYILFF